MFVAATLVLLLTGLGLSAPAPVGQGDPAVSLLASTRQALGGKATLGSVTTWTASGTLTRNIGPRSPASTIEISCALPDRFVQVTRQQMSQWVMTRSVGFNGDVPITETVAPGAPFPVSFPPPPPGTPEEAAAQQQRQVTRQKRTFVQYALPLFAESFAAYPLDFSVPGQTTPGADSANVVEAKGPDGFTWRMFVDAATHLPVRISWMDKPFITFTTQTTMLVPAGSREQPASPPGVIGRGPVPPPGDPTIGLADVEWETRFSDYRTIDGVTWPHRWTTSYGGVPLDDVQIEKFVLNPAIDQKVFTPGRR